jgi:hypothetical protein
MSGEENDREIGYFRHPVRTQLSGNFRAVHVRHFEIEHHEIDRSGFDNPQGFRATGAGFHREPKGLQRLSEETARGGLVVDHQNPRRSHAFYGIFKLGGPGRHRSQIRRGPLRWL